MIKRSRRLIAAMVIVLVGTVGIGAVVSHVRHVRDRNTCLNNMRQISAGVWATGLAKSLANGAVVPVEEVVSYLKNGLPHCLSSLAVGGVSRLAGSRLHNQQSS